MKVDESAVTLRDLPDRLLGHIIHNLQSFPNETVDFSTPHVRRSLHGVYPLLVTLYGLVMVLGTAGNVLMVRHVLLQRRRLLLLLVLRQRRRRRLAHAKPPTNHHLSDPIHPYLVNIGVCNLLVTVVLVPLSLTVLLLQNWVFGRFLCYFLPMLQVS